MKKLILLVIVGLVATLSNAQNSERPWLIGISTNYADFNAVEMKFTDQLTDANWMGETMPSQLKVARLLNKSFSLGAEFSIVELEPEKLNLIPVNSEVTTDKFWRIAGQIEYRLANGYILKEQCRFDPYLFLGLGGTNVNEVTYLAQNTGLGFNIWLADWAGLNFEGSYDYMFDWNDYFHYSAGLVFRIGKKADMDGDGIADKLDKCPEIAGLETLEGCPDADGDGIADHLDRCPDKAGNETLKGCPDSDGDNLADIDDECPDTPGLAELKGCPDKDGDGIADHKDDCPEVAGPAQLKGCPDSDGDGIADNRDDCPEVHGIPAFKGCPDTDGDGVVDHLDECPNEKGLTNNNGCPMVEQAIEALEFNSQNVFFDISSSTIRPISFANLDEIVKIMKDYPDTKFSVYGYTDNTGPKDFNLQLSKDRANSVATYFKGKGISSNRLTVDGFGINNPIDTNDTPEGRAKNRRVEIKRIQ